VNTSAETFFRRSHVYEPIALLRRDGQTLVIAAVGMRASQRFMIVTPGGDPAWPHEPFNSLSDVGWSLRAHEWHLTTPEPAGQSPRPAKTLARLLAERA
jgi:hypothetical protein